MEALKPFKMPARAAPSALASFAKTLESRPVMLPTTEPLRGLEPKNLLAKLDGNAGNMASSHNLSPLKPIGTSTLAAFAKSVVLEPGLQDKCLQDRSPSKPPGELKKRPSQLERIPKDKERAKEGGGLEEKRERQTDKTVRPREEHSESKYENEVEESTHKELPSQERKYSESSGSEIDMAEFACSDSEEEPTDAGTTSDHNSYNLLHDDDRIVLEPKVTRVPTIFLPKTTNDEVIYAISIRDNDYLATQLSTLSPTDLLLPRDADCRTVYHYAALSKSERIRRMVFNFVGVYFDIKASEDMSSLRLALQRVQHPRDGDIEWNPPRVKEVKSKYDKVKYDNYREVCSLEDAYGRSLLHYLAVNERWLLSDLNPALLKVLKSEKRILLTRDQCNRYPLQYSILHGNIKCIHFWFSLGISQELSKPDIDQWVALNSSAEVYSLLYRQLELHDAARYDDTKKTADSGEQSGGGLALLSAHLLSKTLSINKNTPTSKLRLPLHRAAIYGDTDTIEALLKSGTDPNSQDSDGWTALHFGAAGDSVSHINGAQILLDHRVNINATTLRRKTPLHIAASQQKDKRAAASIYTSGSQSSDAMVSFLLQNGANLDALDEDGYTPFLIAVKSGNVSAAWCVLDAGCNRAAVDRNRQNALHIAVVQGASEMIRFLSRCDGESMLWSRMRDRHDHLPIHIASSEPARLAMQNLWVACHEGNVAGVRLHLDQYRRNQDDRSTVWKYLGVKEQTFEAKRTALHLAVQGLWDHLGIPKNACDAKNLRMKSRQVDSDDVRNSYIETIGVLLNANANVSAGDIWGVTPLMLAAGLGDDLLLEEMLRFCSESDIGVRDLDGNTAIHYSYAFGHANISSLLEDASDDSEPENNDGKAPLSSAGLRDKVFPKGLRDNQSRVKNWRKAASKDSVHKGKK